MSLSARIWTGLIVATQIVMAGTLMFDHTTFSEVASYKYAMGWPGARWVWLLTSYLIVAFGIVGRMTQDRRLAYVAWGLTGPMHLVFGMSLLIVGASYVGGMMWFLVSSACYLLLLSAVRQGEGLELQDG